MSDSNDEIDGLSKRRDLRVVIQFLVLMALYIATVYANSLWIYPLGVDYALLANPWALPWPSSLVWTQMISRFGDSLHLYHLANLALLYGCMVFTFFLTRYVVRGLWWLGSLTAVMMMANPLKSEAVLHLSGCVNLLPAFFALGALAFYAAHIQKGGWLKYGIALLFFWMASIPFRQNLGLLLMLPLLEALIAEKEERRWARLIPIVLIAAVASYTHRECLTLAGLNLRVLFAPLFLIPYPIGMLPQTAARFHLLGPLSAAIAIGLLVLVHRKVRRPAFLFGLLAMCGVRLFQGTEPIDMVHMTGGGGLILSIVFFNIAFAAMCLRIQDHPKWRRPVILITTSLCLLLFALQVRSNMAWNHAGRQVQAFQETASETLRKNPESSLGILPDFQYYRDAPMRLSSAVAYDTLFSRMSVATPLLPLNYDPAHSNCTVTAWEPEEGHVVIEGMRPVEAMPAPYRIPSGGDVWIMAHTKLGLTNMSQSGFTLSIRMKTGPLPEILISAPLRTKPGVLESVLDRTGAEGNNAAGS
jgi:hypothetical protein